MYADRDHQPAPELRADRPHPPLADAPSSLLAAFDAAQLAGTAARELARWLGGAPVAVGARTTLRPVRRRDGRRMEPAWVTGAHDDTMPTSSAVGEFQS